jgi:isochorismate synthase
MKVGNFGGENQSSGYTAIKDYIAFVQWRDPELDKINTIQCYYSQISQLKSFSDLDKQDGFVFAPFLPGGKNPIFVFPFENIEFQNVNTVDEFVIDKCLLLEKPDCNSESKYQEKIGYLLNFLNTQKIRKAVLSRYQCLEQYNYKKVPELFEKLCSAYPNALVYQVFIPNQGYWVGATPELLLSVNENIAATVSLAATQPLEGEIDKVKWNQKELTEQELVSEHIRKILSQFKITKYSEIGPETYKAGSLVHLRTQFEFDRNFIDGQIGSFLSQLHPTPAVCGLPVEFSRDLLLQIEGYDRAYYTGFLGRLSHQGETKLFVNLRCLQAFKDGVVLYAGGGITKDSNPESEWVETQLKIQTLQRILQELN